MSFVTGFLLFVFSVLAYGSMSTVRSCLSLDGTPLNASTFRLCPKQAVGAGSFPQSAVNASLCVDENFSFLSYMEYGGIAGSERNSIFSYILRK